MAYSLGGVEPWSRNWASTDEVYIWRGQLINAPVQTRNDVQDIARAAANAQKWAFDLRGVVVRPLPANMAFVDAVYTSKLPQPFFPYVDTTSVDVAQRMQTQLLPRWPNVIVLALGLFQITSSEPKHPALDFWRNQPVLWDWSLTELKPVPTDSFAAYRGLFRGVESSRTQGNAEDGAGLKLWTDVVDPVPEPPDPDDGPDPGNIKPGNGTSTGGGAWWVYALAGAAAWWLWRSADRVGKRARS